MKPKELLTSHKKFHINLGLERISKILDLLDNPQEKYQIIHIAGTNGKGSVSKIINQILIEQFKNQDKKIGLFTSPHLFNYEERIKINNLDIPSDIFSKLINEIDSLALNNNIELTEFELITAVAFYYFYLEKTDFVVLEVGLGGKYDATNIIKNPLVEIITTIDFDHSERLGQTIEEIAIQKAGIIKENSNVVILKENFGYEVVKKIANNLKAKIYEPKITQIIFEDNKNFALINNQKYEFNLLGQHQGQNLALALEAIKQLGFSIDEIAIKKALKNVQWKFRMDFYKNKNILIDGAHNPSGVKVLRKFLDDNFQKDKKTFIFGCLKNKDYEKMLDILIKEEDIFYYFEFDYPNVLKYNELPLKFRKKAKLISNTNEIFELIRNDNGLKIFCGSLYMLGNTFANYKLD